MKKLHRMTPLPRLCLCAAWGTPRDPDTAKPGATVAGHAPATPPRGLRATPAPRARGTTTGGSGDRPRPGTDRPPSPRPTRLVGVPERDLDGAPRHLGDSAAGAATLRAGAAARTSPHGSARPGRARERGGAGRARPRGGARAVPARSSPGHTPVPRNWCIYTYGSPEGDAGCRCVHAPSGKWSRFTWVKLPGLRGTAPSGGASPQGVSKASKGFQINALKRAGFPHLRGKPTCKSKFTLSDSLSWCNILMRIYNFSASAGPTIS